jgi:hypothetical protein
MNLPILLTALIMTMAVIGHVLIGTRETASLEPKDGPAKPMANWVQSMAAFQMLTPDLIILTGLLYTLALSDALPAQSTFALAIAAYFALQGLLWLGHILWLRRPGATLMSLPHWMVWFVCAGLMVLGA